MPAVVYNAIKYWFSKAASNEYVSVWLFVYYINQITSKQQCTKQQHTDALSPVRKTMKIKQKHQNFRPKTVKFITKTHLKLDVWEEHGVLITLNISDVTGSKSRQSASPTVKSTSLSGDNLGLFDEDLWSRPRLDCAQNRQSVELWAVPSDWLNPSWIFDYYYTVTHQATWHST